MKKLLEKNISFQKRTGSISNPWNQSIQEKDLHHLGELMASSYGEEWTPAQCERYLAKFFKFEPESCKMVVGDRG